MMQRLWIGFLITVFFGNIYALANDHIAFVKNVQGDVKVKRDDTLITIKQRDKLYRFDVIIVKPKSSVGLIFRDGSVLSLDENSYLRIDEFLFNPPKKLFDFRLSLKKGTAIFESGKIGTLSPESFEFHIPEGTIGIRGTKFLVEVK